MQQKQDGKLNCLHTELLGFWTLSIAQYSRKQKHDVSETGCFRPQVWKGENTYSVGPLRES